MNLNDTPSLGGLTEADFDARMDKHFMPPRYLAVADAVTASLTHPAGALGDPLSECIAEQCLSQPAPLEPRPAGPAVIPCRPIPLLARWGMAVSSWLHGLKA